MPRGNRRHLTDEERLALYEALATHQTTATKIADLMNVNPSTIYKARRELMQAGYQALSDAPVEPQVDPVEKAGLRDELTRTRKERDKAYAEISRMRSHRSEIMGLADTAFEPVSFSLPADAHSSAETIVIFLSDIHYGEHVDIEEMDGLNSYSTDIARNRLERMFQGAVALATRHWTGPPPARVILVLGGDMVSGGIHLELAKTDESSPMEACKDLASYIGAGIDLLLKELECPVDIISIPGNHGRSTLKPESKQYAITSYDTLVFDFLELYYRGTSTDRLTFFAPRSGDALFNIYSWNWLATHGDRIGARGGQGFVGPAATAARGFKRLVADYAARGIHLDMIISAHFHTALELEEGYVNASLIGPNQYGRDHRFRPKPATQLFMTVHPRRHVTAVRRLHVGHPDEGSLYAPPEATRPRLRYRVPAVMGKANDEAA